MTAFGMLYAAAAEKDPYTIAIIDRIMPEVDGEALGRKIKSDPSLSQTKLIMMTAVGLRGDAARFKEVGFSAYFTKPFKRIYLYNCIALVIGKQQVEYQNRIL